MRQICFLLLSICLLPASPAVGQASQPKVLHTASIAMVLPDLDGAVRINTAGLDIEQSGMRPDGRQFRIEAKSPDGVFITAFLEVAPHQGNGTEVRDAWWPGTQKNSKFKLSDLQLHELAGIPVAEYTVHEYNGMPVEQHSVHAYYAAGQTWAEIHMSKVRYEPKDEALFEALLQRVEALPTYKPSSLDWMIMASTFYEQKNYTKAAHFYELTLKEEDVSPKLGPVLWHVAVDNLGVSYGISGDVSRAKQTFEQALQKDPNYPLFEYNLACAYGEMNDMQNALPHLKRAFELRKNTLPGEIMPDPMTDDSFRRFKNKAEFVEAVKALPRS